MNTARLSAFISIGAIGGFISDLFGGFDVTLITLIIFMAIDYISGFIVAAVFKKSTKSRSGALESHAGWKGLARKGATLLIVLVAHRLDLLLDSSFIRSAVIIGFTANEALSIIENAGLMGIPIPSVISRSVDILKRRGDTAPSDSDNTVVQSEANVLSDENDDKEN